MKENVKLNNYRIIRNTALLYIRMIICMGIAFFTSRVLLLTLGFKDYGLANVISGIVTMFSFISNMMTSASSRYFTFFIGCEDYDSLKKIFNLTQIIYIFVFFVLLILSESIGLWLLHTKIVIPIDRQNVCLYFYQFSIFSFLFRIISIPYESLIIAHENMKIYSSVSIIDHILKLLIVYIVSYSSADSLFLYGQLVTFVSAIYFFIYFVLCSHNYNESHFHFYWNFSLFKEIICFSGWNLFGATSSLFSNVLVNILLNNYHGVEINAARSIAMQVSTAVSSFMQSFLTAAKPQITKYWSSGNKIKMYKLAETTSKFGYYLMLIVALPVVFETRCLLSIWLDKIPPYTIIFTRLVVISVLIDTVSYPLMTVSQATGNVAGYQTVIGCVTWLNFPVSWLLLAKGYEPDITMWVLISIKTLCLFLRLIIVEKISGLKSIDFINNVLKKCIIVTITSVILMSFRFFMQESNIISLISCAICVTVTIVSIYYFGLSKSEYSLIKENIVTKLTKWGVK